MLLPILAALLMFVEAPATTATPTPAPEATAPAAAPPPADPVFAEVDALMTPWKGKAGDGLRGRLGLSHSNKLASDGSVVFWLTKSESMACGVTQTGEMRCGTNAMAECALGIAFDKEGKVKTWKLQGAPDACRKFVPILAKP